MGVLRSIRPICSVESTAGESASFRRGGLVTKRKRTKARLRLIPLIALAMLIAGFLARRTLGPAVKFHLTHRTPGTSGSSSLGHEPSNDSGATRSGSDDIPDTDRQELNGIIRDRSR